MLSKKGWLRSRTKPLRRRIKLEILRRRALARRPSLTAKTIGITGSSGKTTTTLLVSRLLGTANRTRTQVLENSAMHCAETILDTRRDDDYVIMEIGASAVGTVRAAAEIARPDIAVVTFVGIEHRSALKNRQGVADEKGTLVEAVAPGGFAVLNADDDFVMQMRSRTQQRIVTFGREREADYRVVEAGLDKSGTLTLTIASRHGVHRLETNLVGKHFWVIVAAAVAVAMECGIGIEAIREELSRFMPTTNRCMPYRVEAGPTFILDTVKAPLDSLAPTFAVLDDIDALRKRIVVGPLSDYAGSSKKAYGDAYRMARAAADEVIFAGEFSHRHRAAQEDVDAGLIAEAHSARDLHDLLRRTAVPGEVVLVKSASNAHFERAALAFNQDVRCWEERCGIPETCQRCGMVEYPFEQHARIRAARKRKRFLDRIRGRRPA